MRKLILIITLLVFATLSNHAKPIHPPKSNRAAIPKEAQKLIDSYPNAVTAFADNHLIFADKTTMIWDDGLKDKPFQDLLDNPDLKDMFSQKYTAGKAKENPKRNFDPGRIRNEPFFLKVYGSTKEQVAANLTYITWCPNLVGQRIRVTKVNGIDQKIKQISDELDKHPELQAYLKDIGGTFNWRVIHGTTRHSMHSFGMTVDINTDLSDYWQWHCKCTNEDVQVSYINRIPQAIVDVFEKNGFIWGGKWYHYDTMHFEYRPELF